MSLSSIRGAFVAGPMMAALISQLHMGVEDVQEGAVTGRLETSTKATDNDDQIVETTLHIDGVALQGHEASLPSPVVGWFRLRRDAAHALSTGEVEALSQSSPRRFLLLLTSHNDEETGTTSVAASLVDGAALRSVLDVVAKGTSSSIPSAVVVPILIRNLGTGSALAESIEDTVGGGLGGLMTLLHSSPSAVASPGPAATRHPIDSASEEAQRQLRAAAREAASLYHRDGLALRGISKELAAIETLRSQLAALEAPPAPAQLP